MLHAEFLAITLVLVYVGAVLVLFLFVVMMLDIDLTALQEGFARYLPLGIIIAALIVVEMIAVLGQAHFGLEKYPNPAETAGPVSNTKALGLLLYTVYVYPFEIASVILTVAIIAAITLTLRHNKRKSQDPAQQVKVRSEDRLKVVAMTAEKRKTGDKGGEA